MSHYRNWDTDSENDDILANNSTLDTVKKREETELQRKKELEEYIASLKLQGLHGLSIDIDRGLKKVNEGADLALGGFEEAEITTDAHSKDRAVDTVKKEVRKLQKVRDQLAQWINSPKLRDKHLLQEYRALIDRLMSRWRALEKSVKVKEYSEVSLAGYQKPVNPLKTERDELNGWLISAITKAERNIDLIEGDIGNILEKKGKRTELDTIHIEKFKEQIERHKFHLNKLETLLRMLHNRTIESECLVDFMAQVNDIRDDVEYFLESSRDDDFEENEFMYDDIVGLDEARIDEPPLKVDLTAEPSDVPPPTPPPPFPKRRRPKMEKVYPTSSINIEPFPMHESKFILPKDYVIPSIPFRPCPMPCSMEGQSNLTAGSNSNSVPPKTTCPLSQIQPKPMSSHSFNKNRNNNSKPMQMIPNSNRGFKQTSSGSAANHGFHQMSSTGTPSHQTPHVMSNHSFNTQFTSSNGFSPRPRNFSQQNRTFSSGSNQRSFPSSPREPFSKTHSVKGVKTFRGRGRGVNAWSRRPQPPKPLPLPSQGRVPRDRRFTKSWAEIAVANRQENLTLDGFPALPPPVPSTSNIVHQEPSRVREHPRRNNHNMWRDTSRESDCTSWRDDNNNWRGQERKEIKIHFVKRDKQSTQKPGIPNDPSRQDNSSKTPCPSNLVNRLNSHSSARAQPVVEESKLKHIPLAKDGALPPSMTPSVKSPEHLEYLKMLEPSTEKKSWSEMTEEWFDNQPESCHDMDGAESTEEDDAAYWKRFSRFEGKMGRTGSSNTLEPNPIRSYDDSPTDSISNLSSAMLEVKSEPQISPTRAVQEFSSNPQIPSKVTYSEVKPEPSLTPMETSRKNVPELKSNPQFAPVPDSDVRAEIARRCKLVQMERAKTLERSPKTRSDELPADSVVNPSPVTPEVKSKPQIHSSRAVQEFYSNLQIQPRATYSDKPEVKPEPPVTPRVVHGNVPEIKTNPKISPEVSHQVVEVKLQPPSKPEVTHPVKVEMNPRYEENWGLTGRYNTLEPNPIGSSVYQTDYLAHLKSFVPEPKWEPQIPPPPTVQTFISNFEIPSRESCFDQPKARPEPLFTPRSLRGNVPEIKISPEVSHPGVNVERNRGFEESWIHMGTPGTLEPNLYGSSLEFPVDYATNPSSGFHEVNWETEIPPTRTVQDYFSNLEFPSGETYFDKFKVKPEPLFSPRALRGYVPEIKLNPEIPPELSRPVVKVKLHPPVQTEVSHGNAPEVKLHAPVQTEVTRGNAPEVKLQPPVKTEVTRGNPPEVKSYPKFPSTSRSPSIAVYINGVAYHPAENVVFKTPQGDLIAVPSQLEQDHDKKAPLKSFRKSREATRRSLDSRRNDLTPYRTLSSTRIVIPLARIEDEPEPEREVRRRSTRRRVESRRPRTKSRQPQNNPGPSRNSALTLFDTLPHDQIRNIWMEREREREWSSLDESLTSARNEFQAQTALSAPGLETFQTELNRLSRELASLQQERGNQGNVQEQGMSEFSSQRTQSRYPWARQ